MKRDGDGLLYFVGRTDAMIKSSGNRISPQEIEDAARATGLVSDAAAFGLPDDALGHAIHLVAVPLGPDSDIGEALAQALSKELPNFMQPQKIHIREVLSLNTNGKIDRARLKTELMTAEGL